MDERRFYVKNLPPNVSEDDVKAYFSVIGEISNVSLKNSYGFFTAKSSPQSLNDAIPKFFERNWNGNCIRIEKVEKEDFMTRLAKERKAAANQQMEVNGGHVDNMVSLSQKRKKNFKVDSDSEEEDVEAKAGVPKFRGTKSMQFSVNEKKQSDTMACFEAYDDMWADKDNQPQYSTFLGSSTRTKVKNKSQVNEDKERKTVPHSKIEKKLKDDERRRISLAAKERERRKQQTLIQNALSSKDISTTKKIIFNSDDEEYSNKQTLFDDENNDLENFLIPESGKFEGEKGYKLLQMQTQFNNDERFKMDERFLDDDNEEDKEHKPETCGEMVRFDPSTAASTKSSSVESELPRKTVKKLEVKSPSVPKERFYEVSETIRSSLKESTAGFSLLAAYGGEPRSSMELEKENKEKTRSISKRNPILTDSSDEDDKLELNNGDSDGEPTTVWAPVINISSDLRDNFFITGNDVLLLEGIDFMNKKDSEEARTAFANYDTTRRVLKKIFKDQAAKRARKTDMFRKKVGGMKKTMSKNNKSHRSKQFKSM